MSGAKVEGDAEEPEVDSFDPYPMLGNIWDDMYSAAVYENLAENIFPRDERYAAAILDPVGHRLAFGIPADAYDTIWHYYKLDGTPLDAEQTSQLNRYRWKYKLFEIHTLAVALSRIFGRSLVAKVPRRGPLDWEFRVFVVMRENIVYDNKGEIKLIRVRGALGNRVGLFEFRPGDFVLYRDIQDPFGAREDGIPALTPFMRHLIMLINMKWNIAKAITMRGLGFLLVGLKVPPSRAKELIEQLRRQWQDPETYSTLIYPQQLMDVQTLDSQVSRSSAVNDIIEQFTKDIAGGAGVGTSKIQGTEPTDIKGGNLVREGYVMALEKIHRIYDKYLVELFKLINPKLPQFYIQHEYKLQKDPLHKAQLYNYYINAFRLAPHMFLYNEAREMLDLPPIPEFDGKLISEVMVEGMGPSGVGSSTKEGMLGQKDVNKTLQDKIRLRMNVDSLREEEKKLAESLFVNDKEEYALRLLQNNFSINKTNQILRSVFGSGFTNTKLVEMRKELDRR